jgi:ribose transport system permease protein
MNEQKNQDVALDAQQAELRKVDEPIKSPSKIKQALQTLISKASLLPFLIILWVVFAISTPSFATFRNLHTLLAATAVIAVAAIGETLILLTAGIDISVASVIACSAILSAYVMDLTGGSIVIGILVALGVGLVFGLFNGFFVSKLGLTPFVLTLGTHLIARGIAFTVSKGYAIRAPELVRKFGRSDIFGLPSIAIIAIVLMLVFGFILSNTTWGRHVMLIGANANAARYVGIRNPRIIASVYVLSGLLSGVAGFLSIANLGAAIPGVGDPILLTIIGGVILGGTSMFGGIGSMGKTAIGVLLLATLTNGLNLMGYDFYDQLIAQGIVIVIGTALIVKFGQEQQPA